MLKNKNIKKFITDMFFNTFSFGIYILAQQIILMPIMSKLLNQAEYANYIIYISIFAIISNTLGSELGITRQVRDDKSNASEYNRILLVLLPIIVVTSNILLFFLKYDFINNVLLTIPIVLANIRLYSVSYFRMNKDFKKVLIQNILYLLGIMIGIILYKYLPYVWLPTLLGEIFALTYSINKVDILTKNIKKTNFNKKILENFIDLGTISLLVNGMVYLDKVLIYPILGEVAVTIYYATSSMSKIISLIVNPLYSVILSWLKADNDNFKSKVMSLTIKSNIPIVIITFLLSIPLTYIALQLLYSQYLDASKILIIPVCIGLAFSTVSSLIKAILLKYMDNKKILKAYIFYFIIFIISAVLMSKKMGLIGFAYSNALSKFTLWIIFLWLLKTCNNNIQKKG